MKRVIHALAITFVIVFVIGLTQAEAHDFSSPSGFYNFLWDLLEELCPIRHPLGHQSLFSWNAPASPGTSLLQWGSIFGLSWLGLGLRKPTKQ